MIWLGVFSTEEDKIEWNKNVSSALFGKKQTPEHIEKNRLAHSKPVSVLGNIYSSQKEASKVTGIPMKTLNTKVNSDKFPEYFKL